MSKTFRDQPKQRRWRSRSEDFRCRHCRTLVGALPLRPKDAPDGGNGALDGSSSKSDWQLYVPPDLLSGKPFWEMAPTFWDEITDVGVRSTYVASVFGRRCVTA